MALMAWALGKYQIDNFIETGAHEGETIGYFSKFCRKGFACDINPQVAKIALERYPHLSYTVGDVITFLEWLPELTRTFFYLDCTWEPGCYAKEQVPIIYRRFDNPIVFVSGVRLPNGSSGAQQLEDLTLYGKVIIPKYGMRSDESGYALIVSDKSEVFVPNSWEII
jgi:hypothetical protein